MLHVASLNGITHRRSNLIEFPDPVFVETNGIRMATYEQGSGAPVIFLHGFPELAYSWRHQLPALAAAGYRAIAPDLRGYGQSSAPDDLAAYTMDELIADVHGLLDALQLESATFVGHDWGALILWHMALLAPERIERMAILNVPHFARAPIDPIQIFRNAFGDDFYIVNFQDSDEADRVFAADPGRFINNIMRRNAISRAQFEQLPREMQVIRLLPAATGSTPPGEPLLTATELDYYAQAFANSGFSGPINWYRNWTRNWKRFEGVDQVIRVPTLFIGAADDVVIRLDHIEAMRPLVPDLEIQMLEPCGHWSQQERPDDVNRLLLDWLAA